MPGLSRGAIPQVLPTSDSLPTQDDFSSTTGLTTFQRQLKTSPPPQRAAEPKDLPLAQAYLEEFHPRNLEVILPVLLQPGSSPPPPY